MKPTAIISIVACTGIAAFLIGKMSSSPADPAAKGSSEAETPTDSSRKSREFVESGKESGRERSQRPPVETKQTTPVIDATKMTREERLSLLGKAAVVSNNGDHVEKMLAVIAALQPGEMKDAVNLIGNAQTNGNFQAPQVWTAMWYQWGKVDPLECFARFRAIPSGKGPGDARNTMRGWLETDPQAALAWAKQPDRTPLEASAAAMALAHAANGDPSKLQADLQSMPEGNARKLGIRELYDMEVMKDGGRGAAQIYDSFPESMKADAWGPTAKLLATTDQAAAKEWVTQHAGEPGTDYLTTLPMVRSLAKKDPEGTAKWALNLPANDISPDKMDGPPHPVIEATFQWVQQDAAAAETWLRGLPEEQKWTGRVLEMIERRKGGNAEQQ
jgi:hypothetical protein